jgi:PAT family beta-lactamase induction signal transducer AmpG
MEQPSPTLTDSRNGRLILFGYLYFVQGAMIAYVLVFNNLYLRHFGASAGRLSVLNGLLVIPFILKIGLGILSDKVQLRRGPLTALLGTGHRLPYMRVGLLLIASGALVTAFVHPVERYGLFLTTALLIAFGLSLFDTVTDGFAIDVTPEDQQKSVQGAMVVGRAVGLVLLTAIYGRLIERFGWQIVFYAIVIFSLSPLLLLRKANEPKQRPESHAFAWTPMARLWRREIGLFFLYAVVYAVPVYGTNAIITLFANEGLGGTLVQVGDVAALAGLGMVIGGTAAVAFSRRISIWKQATGTGIAVSIALILIALLADLDNFIIFTFIWGLCLSAADFNYVTFSMAKSDRRVGAGQFAIFMAISNIGTGIGQATTTALIDTISFRWIFAGLAIINLLLFPLLAAMRAENRRQPLAAADAADSVAVDL